MGSTNNKIILKNTWNVTDVIATNMKQTTINSFIHL